jgi:ribosomal protein L32
MVKNMVKHCKICSKVFDDYLDMYDMCPDCREKEEKLLREVKDYLWENPGASEKKLEELFGATHKQIVKWLRNERLEITPASSIKLTCKRCGSMILSGNYCKDCISKVGNDLKELEKSLKPKEDKHLMSMVIDKTHKAKMHFVENEGDKKK